MVIAIIIMVVSWIISMVLRSRFNAYGKIGLRANLSGREIAERMLRENGIHDVKVVSHQGFLSDHYDPTRKTVNLSPEVYEGRSVSAAAVAAHECGHAVQHATAYSWLKFRTQMVPAVQFSSSIGQWILIAGLILYSTFPGLLLAGIVLFGLTTLFTIITLPVEFDASNRALAWLNRTNITDQNEYPKAKDALKWAAMTYVMAALGSIAMLLHYIMMFMGGSRNDD